MRAVLVLALVALVPGSLRAQSSPYARLIANARFNDHASVVWRRTLSPSFAPSLVDQFDRAVATAADETGSRQDLVDVLGRFDPLWDATGRLKPAAVTRYLPRVAAVPPAAVSTWATMSGMDRRRAAFSLAGLESLWTADQFNTLAFAALVAKWRAS